MGTVVGIETKTETENVRAEIQTGRDASRALEAAGAIIFERRGRRRDDDGDE